MDRRRVWAGRWVERITSSRRDGIPSVALRYGMFVPEPFFRYGIRLLYGGVDSRDVARAMLAALDALIGGSIRWDAFNVQSVVPFSETDGPLLRRDPLEIVDRYYPGTGQLLRERGVSRLAPIVKYYPMTHIEQRLGFRPQHNFEQWLEELRARPLERAPETSPWWSDIGARGTHGRHPRRLLRAARLVVARAGRLPS